MNTLPQNTVVFKTNTTGIVQGNVILMSGEMSELNGINILVSDCNDLQLFISGTTAMLRFVSNIFSNGKENVPLIFYFYFTIPEPLEDDEIHQITRFMLNLPGGNPVHELQKMTRWRSFIEPRFNRHQSRSGYCDVARLHARRDDLRQCRSRAGDCAE